MLVKAVEAEVAAYIETHQHEVDENGRRLVVRNGHARERTLVSGVGQLKIQARRGSTIAESMSGANASVSLPRSCRPICGARKASKNSSRGCT